MDNKKVYVVSTVNGTVGISLPEYGFRKDYRIYVQNWYALY